MKRLVEGAVRYGMCREEWGRSIPVGDVRSSEVKEGSKRCHWIVWEG